MWFLEVDIISFLCINSLSGITLKNLYSPEKGIRSFSIKLIKGGIYGNYWSSCGYNSGNRYHQADMIISVF